MKIVIPGGTGQVGHILARHFHQEGHSVTVLSRRPHAAPWRVIPWDGVTLGPWIKELDQSDASATLQQTAVPYWNRAFVPRRYSIKPSLRFSTLLPSGSTPAPPRSTVMRSTVPWTKLPASSAATNQAHPIPGTSQFRWRRPGKKHSSSPRLLGRGRSRYVVP